MVEAGSKQQAWALEKTELRAHILYYKPEAEKTDWKKEKLSFSNPASRNTLSPPPLHLLNFPKQCH